MGIGTALHYVGSVMLFVAMVLTIVVDISAPVVKNITFINLDLPGDADARMGVFGYCTTGGNGGDLVCSRSRVGYDPAKVLEGVDDADFSWGRADTTEALTRVFILHPVGTGVLAIALLLSLLPGSTIASILAAVVSAVAFVINAVAVIVTFVVVNLLLGEVREGTGDGRYGNAVWISLAAAALSLIATILLLFTCCAGRRRRARENRKSVRY
ncbi:pH-response regulator protein palI/prr-like protein [Hapsidospora chrysogenum ATCC 11550]|uniref:pH-response regulator protein palI/prr-like protein n=1 Tax=Hapsidospora chrysogenum (strain ATCC 11550 / CBS 779.69 / DSM 880 / IAM 14645 / JCM 23072 / IMI 49137) TaxID=857340 RepID=A0A086T5X7_HAPC1|nr:pH-response regulator protein palI/prr-like protein [Hapsidospora chrysogenum ATCC 11550]